MLRWTGGYGGDTILTSILSANTDVLSNIDYVKITHNGQSMVEPNREHILFDLTQSHRVPILADLALLEEKIEKTINDTQTHLIKNHYYLPFLDKYSNHMVDIVCTNNLLSFTTSANFYKNYKWTSKFLRDSDNIYKILEQKDKAEADNYMIYQIAVSHYKHNNKQLKSANKIVLDKWIGLEYRDILGYAYDYDIRDQWIEKNQFILDKSNLKIETICDLVKQKVPYNEIRKCL
jgi:hypothetical protein